MTPAHVRSSYKTDTSDISVEIFLGCTLKFSTEISFSICSLYPRKEHEHNSTDKVKIEEKNAIAIPNLTGENLASQLKITNYQITKDGKTLENTKKVGTGYIIKDKDTSKEYTIIVKGDINGDGEIKSNDALEVLKQSAKIVENKGIILKAMDTNKDGIVNSADALLILKSSVGLDSIGI